MKIVFDAANSLEAYLAKGLLNMYEIEAYVYGEHLQSGAGELPMTGCVSVSVADEHYLPAKALIKDWEANKLVSDEWLNEAAQVEMNQKSD